MTSPTWNLPRLSIGRSTYLFSTILLVLAQVALGGRLAVGFFFFAHMAVSALRLRNIGASLWFLLAVPIPLVCFVMLYRLSVYPTGYAYDAQKSKPIRTTPDPDANPSQTQSHSPMPSTAPASFFDIEVPEAHARQPGVYEIAHATPYSIALANQHPNLRCDAKVWIDGTHVGTWRIPAASHIRLERPVNDSGRFTFFQVNTPEARQAGLDEDNPNLGLIRVKFMPERPRGNILASGSASEHGGTGLSGRSDQSFGSATSIDHDETAEIIREIRLTASPAIRPLRAVI
jgi:hypothetical protein